MKISNPSELNRFLTEHNLRAKKSASQNFLIDGNIIRKIVREANLSPDDLVIEIGPGPGALTEALLETGCRVLAIEKDEKLATLLRRLCEDENRLRIFSCDFLTFPIEEYLQKEGLPQQKVKVVANLPYHITTPILSKLLPLHNLLSELVVMVQKEVAVRFVAKTASKDYSCFTLFIQFFSQARHCFTVDPSCFLPRPTVQSSVVRFQLKAPPAVKSEELLFHIIRTSFQQRRKMMRASLKSLFSASETEAALSRIHVSPTARTEELSLEKFIAFSDLFFGSAFVVRPAASSNSPTSTP